jgi:RHS repeat-associated protein
MKHGYGVITYNYDTAMNQLLEYKEDTDNDGEYEFGVEYAYDKQGNPVTKVYKDLRTGQSGRETGREEYTWNDRGELTSITGRVTENYTYDYRGLRHIKDNDGNISKYIYLQNNQPGVVERSRNDTTEQYTDVFVYEGARRVARVRIDGTGNTNTETFINNYQGSPVAVLSDAGEIKYQKYLDPWGNLEMEIGSPSSNIEFQYTDKELDEDTDLYYFQARYYNSIGGRFDSRDKIKLENQQTKFFSINPYVYAKNNPLKYIDPNGKDAILYITNDIPGAGHMGSFYQDNKGNWYRQDLAASNQANKISAVIGKNVKADWKIADYGNQSKEKMLDVVGDDPKITKAMYFEIDDPDKDQAIYDFYAKKSELYSGNDNYNLYQDNCALNTIDGLNQAGLQLRKDFIPSAEFNKILGDKEFGKATSDFFGKTTNTNTTTYDVPKKEEYIPIF